jgi:hypothetical protein
LPEQVTRRHAHSGWKLFFQATVRTKQVANDQVLELGAHLVL